MARQLPTVIPVERSYGLHVVLHHVSGRRIHGDRFMAL